METTCHIAFTFYLSTFLTGFQVSEFSFRLSRHFRHFISYNYSCCELIYQTKHLSFTKLMKELQGLGKLSSVIERQSRRTEIK